MDAIIRHLLETSSNENMTLEILNEKIFLMNQPAIVFICLLFPIGILGNCAVIYIYLCCLRYSNLNLFISSLAFFDLICCLIGINFELIDLFLPVMHPSKLICKFQRLSVFFCCIGSSLMLLAIALERYQKVCRPTNFQFSKFQGRILTFVINFCSLAFSLPVIWAIRIDVPDFEYKLNVSTCEFKSSVSWKIYFAAVFLGYSLDLIVNFVLYCLVWRTARRHFLRLDMPDESKLDKDKRKNIRKLHRINRTVISITALFALSFSPFCILSLIPKDVESKNFTIEETIRRVCSRLWILNCTMNPVVYGFCNKEFRIQVKRIVYGLVRKNISTNSSQIDCTEDDENN